MENITESNFLIAKFMGAGQKDMRQRFKPNEMGYYYWYWLGEFKPIEYELSGYGGDSIVTNPAVLFYYNEVTKVSDELLFHSSWDWLMPVVEKIQSLGCQVYISYELHAGCVIHTYGMGGPDIGGLFAGSGGKLIDLVYTTIITFISAYNEKTK